MSSSKPKITSLISKSSRVGLPEDVQKKMRFRGIAAYVLTIPVALGVVLASQVSNWLSLAIAFMWILAAFIWRSAPEFRFYSQEEQLSD
jgi:hypothetical protein